MITKLKWCTFHFFLTRNLALFITSSSTDINSS